MAEPSKFLEYQDKNGDFLIDECEVDLPGAVDKCLDCETNPNAIVPNWRNSINIPFLNERLCLYQVGIQTPYTKTGDTDSSNKSLEEKFEEYKAEAIDLFLTEYDKEYTSETFLILEKAIQYDLQKDFELEARAGSRLKLLYSLPFSALEAIDDADEDEEEEDTREPIEVTYQGSEFVSLMIRVRKGLNLYARYVKYYKYVKEENLVFTKTGKLFDIDRYGDSGFNRTKTMAQVLIQLDDFLKGKGFNIPGGGVFGPFKDRVVKLTLGFDPEFKLKKLKVYTVGCAEKPTVFKGRKISGLNRRQVFKDRTAMAYLAQLREMESDLSARAPKKFSQFLIDYTYPAISVVNSAELQASLDEQSCVAQAISEKANSIGQDVLDEVFGGGVAIAGAFNEKMCKQLEDVRAEQLAQGQNYTPVEELQLRAKARQAARTERKIQRSVNELEDTLDEAQASYDEDYRKQLEEEEIQKKEKKKTERREARGNAKAAAAEQAYKELQANPNIYVRLCAEVLINKTKLGDAMDARDMWDGTFHPMKQCGLLDFFLDAIQCLFGGLTLQDALLIMVTKALEAMGMENFGRLFAGLPPEEQARLDDLVKRKLAEAEDRSNRRQPSEFATVGEVAAGEQGEAEKNTVDAEASMNPLKNINFVRPFEKPELLEQERSARVPGPVGSTTVSSRQYEAESQNFGRRRTIGTVYPVLAANSSDPGRPDLSGPQTPAANRITGVSEDASQIFSDSKIMEAYIGALIELYADRLLDLVDKLNEFPGAEIISKTLALIDCPRPPLFTPSIMDFIKDIELPFCRNIGDIALPKLFLPKLDLGEILEKLVEAIKEEIRKMLYRILFKLIAKVCEILGEAICKALETAGDIIGGLPGLITGNTTFKDIIRESICGPDAPEEQVNGAIQDLFSTLGGAGSNLANKDRVVEFSEAVASSSTREEIISASLGEASSDFLTIVDTIIEFEFPDLREAFSNTDDIAAFYKNFGNLLPEDFKASLADSIRGQTPDERALPANPTLCATPEQIEEFCSVRSEILQGRASPEQIAQLCENTLPTENFDTIADALQKGLPATIMDNMPPIKSKPGCDDGLFPREPEEMVSQASRGLSEGLENLKIAYSYDMLGNGPFKKNWGFINMVLSDTMGRPYTAHRRKNFNDPGQQQYVDFYVPNEVEDTDDSLNFARPGAQRGAFPKYIAEWQAIYFSQEKDNFLTIGINNDFKKKQTKFIPFGSVDSGARSGIEKSNLTRLPDFGYDYKINTIEQGGEEGIKLTFRPRKRNPDILLQWRDNNGGTGGSLEPLTSPSISAPSTLGADGTFQIGYNFKLFFADFDGKTNRRDDNVRMQIVRRTDLSNFMFNTAVKNEAANYGGAAEDFEEDDLDVEKKDTKIVSSKEYEFMSFDEGLVGIIEEDGSFSDEAITNYPKFVNTLEKEKPPISPTIALMADILDLNTTQAEAYWNETVATLVDEMGKRIFDLEGNKAFRYGAKFDPLTAEDAEYGVIRGGNFVDYADATNSEGDSLTNSDAELGLSRDQFNNRDNPERARVIYLDPAAHGGSYTNPKYYIKPIDNDGWFGLVNVMFPELSPCKPYRTDLINFSDIDAVMSNSYSTTPDDRRLIGDPDCVTEKPFDRILDRSAKAGIKGTIMASCRIYASINFLKAAATFSKFKPDFRNNFSNLFASYIIEEMERDMRDSQSGFAELFNPFKDEEFWYAFLEQAVQTYHDQIEAGEIEEIPNNVLNALREIGQIQSEYKYPGRKKLKNAKKTGDARTFQTLKNYRETKNLEAVKAAEEHAKVILKEYVTKEVNFIADIFENNLVKEGFVDKGDYVNNIYYHILSEFTDGSDLTLDREIKEEVTGIGEGGYTDGDEFSLEEDGTPYVGYYHIHEDESGQPIFMVGERHSDEPHAVLVPFARNVQLNIGDISATVGGSVSGNNPFIIKKYLSVDGERLPMSAVSGIKNGPDGEKNISDVYPGTLEHVYDNNTEGRPIVGLKGELGIRYGIAIYARSPSGTKEIASAEIDALDLPIKMLKPLEGGSKELFCLINKLIDDHKFKAFFSYCLPINKILSGLAIYNAFTFMASIGEVVAEGKKRQIGDGFDNKPGLKVNESGQLDFDASVPGWYRGSQRPRFTPFSLTWDEWDKVTLRRSNAIIKRMFKSYYYSRNFDEGEDKGETGAKIVINNLKELFSLAPGQRIMPWWKRRASNPFNDKGEMCERKE